MDIPFVRFACSVAVLYVFYWALFLNPVMDDEGAQAKNGGLTIESARDLLDHSKKLLAEKKFDRALPDTLRLHRAFPENHIYIDQLAGKRSKKVFIRHSSLEAGNRK